MMSHPWRVLIIDNLAVESSRRGIYRTMAQGDDLEIHLLVPNEWKETTHRMECEPEGSSTLRVHRSGILFGFRHHRVVYTRLFQILTTLKPDLLLAVHAPEHYATLQTLVLRRMFRPAMKVALFASRNIDLPSVGFPYKLAFVNKLCDSVAAKSGIDAVFHRPRLFGHLYTRYSREIIYIPHYVDCSAFKPGASRDSDSNSLIMLGYIGRLTSEKGVDILVQAMAGLPPYVHLMIVGEGASRTMLETLVSGLKLKDRVQFRTTVPFTEMPQVMNQLDILVLPSRETTHWKELFGRVLIEAMASGISVVASNSGGIPEVVGDVGVLVEPDSVADLREKLSGLVTDQHRRSLLGNLGRERALAFFDMPVVAQTLKENLMSLVSSRQHAGHN